VTVSRCIRTEESSEHASHVLLLVNDEPAFPSSKRPADTGNSVMKSRADVTASCEPDGTNMLPGRILSHRREVERMCLDHHSHSRDSTSETDKRCGIGSSIISNGGGQAAGGRDVGSSRRRRSRSGARGGRRDRLGDRSR
jgi:hypothetical protein